MTNQRDKESIIRRNVSDSAATILFKDQSRKYDLGASHIEPPFEDNFCRRVTLSGTRTVTVCFGASSHFTPDTVTRKTVDESQLNSSKKSGMATIGIFADAIATNNFIAVRSHFAEDQSRLFFDRTVTEKTLGPVTVADRPSVKPPLSPVNKGK